MYASRAILGDLNQNGQWIVATIFITFFKYGNDGIDQLYKFVGISMWCFWETWEHTVYYKVILLHICTRLKKLEEQEELSNILKKEELMWF
ncbi:unnamed protein product [Lathyrus oleraceus]